MWQQAAGGGACDPTWDLPGGPVWSPEHSHSDCLQAGVQEALPPQLAPPPPRCPVGLTGGRVLSRSVYQTVSVF